MKKLGIIVLVLLGVYGCFKITYPSGTWRYKLTVTVNDNGKLVTGSSVRQVHIQTQPKFPEGHDKISVKGEAVAVDLGEKGVLFALNKGIRGEDDVFYIVSDNFPHDNQFSREWLDYYSNLKGKEALPFDKVPMLVRFRDINDPKTVELVEPENLAAAFGPGVKLVSVTIEMTNEPVTKGGVGKYIKSWDWIEFNKWQAKLNYGDHLIFNRYDLERK